MKMKSINIFVSFFTNCVLFKNDNIVQIQSSQIWVLVNVFIWQDDDISQQQYKIHSLRVLMICSLFHTFADDNGIKQWDSNLDVIPKVLLNRDQD